MSTSVPVGDVRVAQNVERGHEDHDGRQQKGEYIMQQEMEGVEEADHHRVEAPHAAAEARAANVHPNKNGDAVEPIRQSA